MKDSSSLTFVSWNHKALDAALQQAMIDAVVPKVRAAIIEAADGLAGQFENTPFARYFAQELVIKALADFLTLSDTEELELVRPALLADPYVRDWFDRS